MRIHYLQHLAIETLGSIENWGTKGRHTLSVTRLYKNEIFPDLNDFDWLIIMGGPMSVNDEADYPWLKREKIFIRQAIDAGKTVIGICLGAQLIAASLNAAIRKNEFKEIGWFPVHMTEAAKASRVFSHLPGTIDAFHWHGETFDLPEGAIRIAGSDACTNQAFSLDDKIFGFQFHLETTPQGAGDFIEQFADELIDAPYIHTADTILSPASRFSQIHLIMASILDRIDGLHQND